MRLLLDTPAALWRISDDRRAIARPDSVRLFSVASAWELTIKSSPGKLRLPLSAGKFLEEHFPRNRIDLLPITVGDLTRAEALPFHHRDPFDRLLGAQALERDLALVSIDAVFERYGLTRVW